MRKSPPLDLDDGVSWRARPYAELHATNEKKRMRLTEERPKGFWPVHKGESFDIWDSDTGTYYAWADPEKIQRYLQKKRKGAAGKKNSPFTEFDRAWVEDPATLPCLHPRTAFRDVSRATDTRTVRAAVVPANVVITNAAPYFVWIRGDKRDEAFLPGVLCSIPLDWYARRMVEKHLNYHVLNPLPIPRPAREDGRWNCVVLLAGRLAAQDRRLRSWAKRVGVECGKLGDEDRADMVAELDAVVAHLYGLSEVQLRHVFETFHEGWDPSERLEAVLRHYRDWAGRS